VRDKPRFSRDAIQREVVGVVSDERTARGMFWTFCSWTCWASSTIRGCAARRSGFRGLAKLHHQCAWRAIRASTDDSGCVPGRFRRADRAPEVKGVRIQQELLTQSAQDAARLSDMRYRGGVASYLEVLTNDTNAFSAELALAQAKLNELLAIVQVYQALGGGWQQ
jgi:hypothetical protein